jgi:hypothetical protein
MDNALACNAGRIIEVKAGGIKDAQEAGDLRPFFDSTQCEVGYVSRSHRNKQINVVAHFRHFPHKKSFYEKLQEDITQRQQSSGESQVHLNAKHSIASGLNDYIRRGTPLPWQLFDRAVSSFRLAGNLLGEVSSIKTEYPVVTPYGLTFRADIALLQDSPFKMIDKGDGPAGPVLRAIVEIEHKHKSELLKCLAVQSMGVPLLAIDISCMSGTVSAEWASSVLAELITPEVANRKCYLHLPMTLYPTFLDIPPAVRNHDCKHEFVIFVRDDLFTDMLSGLDSLKRSLSLHDDKVQIIPYNKKRNEDEAVFRTLRLIGPLCGPDWTTYSSHRFVRVRCDVPYNHRGNIYRFNLCLATLLARYPAIAGYKHYLNADVRSSGTIWLRRDSTGDVINIAPRQLSDQAKKLNKLMANSGITLKRGRNDVTL